MKKLNITKEQFEKSRYFKNKYGTLEYVSESGKVFKTNKGKLLKFKESIDSEGDDVIETIEEELNSMVDKLNELKHLAIEKLEDKKLAKDLENLENQVAEVYYDV